MHLLKTLEEIIFLLQNNSCALGRWFIAGYGFKHNVRLVLRGGVVSVL